jgi:hypothetical protein
LEVLFCIQTHTLGSFYHGHNLEEYHKLIVWLISID